MKKLLFIIGFLGVVLTSKAAVTIKAEVEDFNLIVYRNDTVFLDIIYVPKGATITFNIDELKMSYYIADQEETIIQFIRDCDLKHSFYSLIANKKDEEIKNNNLTYIISK